jgi:deoxyribonuclease IV
MNRYIGFHVSIAGGIHKALQELQIRTVNTGQIFLKNSNRWQGKPYTEEMLSLFFAEWEHDPECRLFAHSGYLINPAAAADEENWQKSVDAIIDELQRAETLRIPWLVLHPGNHKGRGEAWGIKRVAYTLDRAIEQSNTTYTGILLETTAGQGTSLGYSFEHLRDIIALSKYQQKFGICFDTCHAFAAGYDFRTQAGLSKILEKLDTTIGIPHVHLIHLNDSKHEIGSRRDRHEHIGEGKIGWQGFKNFLQEEAIAHVPIVMETPKEKGIERETDMKNLRVVYDIIAS